jgi:antitoxin HicB
MAKKQKEKLKYEVKIEYSAVDKCYVARVPELPGCSSDGDTLESAVKNIQEAMEAYLDSLKDRKITPPVPFADKKFSGNFPIRTDPGKHRAIAEAAKKQDKSINEFVIEAALEKLKSA